MAKRKFAVRVATLLSIGGLLASFAQAHEIAARADGCRVLAELVYTEVTTSVWQGPGSTQLALPDPARAEVATCARTTETVSRAFKAAMQAVGTDVTWSSLRDPRMEACMGGFIEQCDLDGGPYQPLTLDAWGVDIMDSWKAVQHTVRTAMPEGSAVDRSIFSRESMQRALRQSLNSRNGRLRRHPVR